MMRVGAERDLEDEAKTENRLIILSEKSREIYKAINLSILLLFMNKTQIVPEVMEIFEDQGWVQSLYGTQIITLYYRLHIAQRTLFLHLHDIH